MTVSILSCTSIIPPRSRLLNTIQPRLTHSFFVTLPQTPMATTTTTTTATLTLPRATLTPISTCPSLSLIKLPEFKGLRLAPTRRSLRSLTSRVGLPVARSARIVSETPEAAVSLSSVTDATWKSLVLESDIPVMVEFWAPWCGPCRIVQPVIDELAQQFAGKLKAYKINTDENPTIASDYGVRSIPTVLIFKNGEKKEAIIGAVPKSTLTSSIEKFL